MNKNFKFPFWNPEIEQVVDDFIKAVQVDNTKDFGWAWSRPLANIEESQDQYQILLAAPGLTKADFKLSIDKDQLNVEVDKPKTESSASKVKTEYAYHKFKRSFKIGENVNQEGIKATYEQGILTISLPKKTETSQGPKTINIL